MRRLLPLLLVLPLLVLSAPSAQAATCELVPEPTATFAVGDTVGYSLSTTGCATDQKQPSFKVVDGDLPRGLRLTSFASSSALISGTPTTAGTFTFTVQVKDQTRATDTETYTIVIEPAEAPTITTETLNNGTVGESYCCGNLFASGGVTPYAWTVVAGQLPPGLELPKRGNTITGTPTTPGDFTFTVRVTDDLGAFAEKQFTITIS